MTETRRKTLEEEALVALPAAVSKDIPRIIEFGEVIRGQKYSKFDRTIWNLEGVKVGIAVNVDYELVEVNPQKGLGYLINIVEVLDCPRREETKGMSVFLPSAPLPKGLEEVKSYCIDYISELRKKQIELFRKRGYFVKDCEDLKKADEPSSGEAKDKYKK